MYFFILGGMTLSEMRAIYSLNNEDTEVFLGSTSILRPDEFVEEIHKIQTPNDDSYEDVRRT